MGQAVTARAIRELRQRLGWSRATLAKALGCSEYAVASMELGRWTPPPILQARLQTFAQWTDPGANLVKGTN